ncbi:DNA topoisomerase I [Loktanella fryxellensis]|uniref:DNA topoisomerase 1 n=1 Tax=Loktanella fryxellensis TaxID=245187 RepID=A0A1H8G0J9_9RHOB|nr:type I DNA topoisomerase [Loktanella fryxellensis]SEN36848.1 DNA topoisomerase I [Loktanella fryxellensis]
MPVVVVESPAKAKTINKYLGSDYTVLASYGHIRDLPAKNGSVLPDDDFSMIWEVASDSKKHIKAIVDALKEDPNLILATDPDREGEAISWHLQEELGNKRGLKIESASRVVFNAITKSAVTEAMKNPRQVDMPLVDAYLARRALDYLVGFNLSPVLWRKLPGAKSAGRVQSVCLRLIVEREMEIEAFRNQEYWTVRAILQNPRGATYEARLTTLGGKRLDKFDLGNATQAEMAVQAVNSRDLTVVSTEAKPASRNPSPPFMTSTLQQEASRKFGMGAKQCMGVAQRLYEAGFITYMRTDGIDMAPEAVTGARDAIKARFGDSYVPKEPRIYKNKAKNAQEAHECIRPTDMIVGVEQADIKDADQRKLYDLIWKRTLASQMEAARMERTVVEIGSRDGQVGLRANGQVMLFDGFLRVYEEGRDDVEGDDDKRLPQIAQGEVAKKESVDSEQHFTQPPPRYTEATLVKRMEELGIGRPSTYASIVTTIQDRGYVEKDKNRLIPQDKGRLVTAFLSNYFHRYVEYDFTADLEDQLDRVSAGNADYKALLARFWRDFSAAIAETADLRIGEVLDKINDVLAPHLFPDPGDGTDPRLCPNCGQGRLSMRTARAGGAFIGCSNYPECRYTRPFGPPDPEAEKSAIPPDGKLLGTDGDDEIRIFKGRFGPFAQRGAATEEVPKPLRQSVPADWEPEGVTLEQAVRLLELPRLIGPHPEDGVNVWSNIGRYGPYIKHAETTSDRGGTNANLETLDDVWTVGMNHAVQLLAEKVASRGTRGKAVAALRELGEHPLAGGPVGIYDGKYGPYVKWDKLNATIPDTVTPEDLTLAQAVDLLDERAAKAGKPKPGAGKKAAAKKAAPKKAAAKPAAKAAAGKTPAAKKPAAKPAAKTPAVKKPAAKAAKPAVADDTDGDVFE